MRLRHLALCAVLLACGPAQESAPPVVVAVGAPEPAPPPTSPAKDPTREQPEPPAPSPAPAPRDPLLRARDTRKSTAAPRSPELVTVEIEQLEKLFATVSARAPDRPALLRRIAESNVELSRALQDRGSEGWKDASRKAIARYATVVADHPTFGQKDDVLYHSALEHELLGEPGNARMLYYELIKNAPQSKHVPGAYFAFGEMFFAEAASDPSKLALAEQAYTEAMKYPPPASTVYGAALLRGAEVAERSGNAQKAAQLRAKLDQLPASDPARTLRRR